MRKKDAEKDAQRKYLEGQDEEARRKFAQDEDSKMKKIGRNV